MLFEQAKIRPSTLEVLSSGELAWYPELGFGFYPVLENDVYNQAYFNKYVGYENTTIGRRLNEVRHEFVERHWHDPLIDIGIGNGAFIKRRRQQYTTLGYDINPIGVKWLRERNLYFDPYKSVVQAASFWDSLEHIEDFGVLLDQIMMWVFVSIPIFRDVNHILTSKHLRKDEHYWYFTKSGFVNMMKRFNFDLVEHNRNEVLAGREDIDSFAFLKRGVG